MLHNTSASSGAGIAKIRGNGDGERSLVCWDGHRVVGKISVGEEGGANNGVGGGVDDRHIGSTGVGSTNVEGKGNGLASRPGLNIGSVVGIFEALALPDVAFGLVVVGLRLGDLEFALDVAIVI